MTSVRSTTDARPGYYSVRLVQGGPRVPGRILTGCHCNIGSESNALHEWTEACDRSPKTVGILCGEEVDPERVWNAGSMREITKKDYDLLVSQQSWDKKYDPKAPLANPKQKVDWNSTKPAF